MELTKEQIVNEAEYVALDTGEILFVNGYMLENRKDNKFFPLTLYFHRVGRIVKYRR